MGLISDRCVNPDCKGRVLKTVKFCRLCGTAAPDADTHCGGCGSVVSSSSKFCWKCGSNMQDQRKVPLFDNRWIRGENDFAVRVDECDVTGFLKKGLIVEHGTRGLVFQAGRFCGYVEPGKYNANGFLRKVNNFNQTTPTSVVIMDVGDNELHLEAIKLYSRDHLEVDAIFKAVVRLNDPEPFYVNAFKGRNHLTIEYVGGSIADELRAALQSFVGTHPVEALYNQAELRTDVEQQMQQHIEPILQRLGMELVLLRFVDFFCPAYDPIRQQSGELYLDTRQADIDIDRLKLGQRLRKEMSGDKMHTIKTDADLENFVRQTEHELGLKDTIRSDEMDKLKRQFAHERNVELLTQQIEIQGIRDEAVRERLLQELQAKIERFQLKRQAEREDRTQEAETDRTIRADDHEQDIREVEDSLNIRQRVEDLEHQKDVREQSLDLERQQTEQQVESERLRARSEASAEALMSILDGPAAEKIAELEKLRIKQNLSPDQLGAMTAADSPQVAQALAEKYKAEAAMSEERFQQMQDVMAQQKATYTDNADRMERILDVSLKQMGLTASTRAQAPSSSQTVVTPTGGGTGSGTPIVVNPQPMQPEKACAHCQESIPDDSHFCPECGKTI